MPSHPDRARSAPLPEGYQFGESDYEPPTLGESYRRACGCFGERIAADAMTSHFHCARHAGAAKRWFEQMRRGPAWRAPHLNAAERIAGYQREYETGRDLGDEA